MSIANLTPSQLRQAADLIEKISGLEKQLAQLQGTKAAPVTAKPVKKKGMSAAGKARISAAAKLRWAKINAAKGKTAAPKSAPKSAPKTAPKPITAKPVKKKFVMSAAAKAKISAAVKARWAKIKAAKK